MPGMGNRNGERLFSSKAIPSGSNLQVEVRKLLACGHSPIEILDWTKEICDHFKQQQSREEDSSMTRQATKTTSSLKTTASKKTAPVKTVKKSDSRQTPSKKSSKRKFMKTSRKDAKVVPEIIHTKEYKLSRWITETKPQRSLYVPQIGDEVVYFWQGHKAYVEAVKKHKVYDIDRFGSPWSRYDLKTEKFMKVVSVKYNIGPPTTCELKLAYLDPFTRKQTGGSFQLRYHDMTDVVDFLVLVQFYDNGRRRNWKRGDRFRTVVGSNWWFGKIEAREPLDAQHPDSLFQCFRIRWDSGELDRLSPWDLEPFVEKNSHTTIGAGNPLTQKETEQLQYKPQKGDWAGNSDQDAECHRILKCLNEIMRLSIAGKLNAPVDLDKYPDYTTTVPYPTDLNTIRKRLELRFYRRRSALEWEVKRIEMNASAYHQNNSRIVRNAKVVTKMLLTIISDSAIHSAVTVCNLLADSRVDEDGIRGSCSESKEESLDSNESSLLEEVSGQPTTPPPRRHSMRRYDDKAWIQQCTELLEILFGCEDSVPFRQPVDESKFPDYNKVIENPMDLERVLTQLDAGMYPDPFEFAKDIRLIVNNSKAYNCTKKKTQVYSMTLKFSALFEDAVRDILQDYKNAANMKLSSNKNKEQQQLTVEQISSENDTPPTNEHDIPGPSGVANRLKGSKSVVQNESSHNSPDTDSDHSVWSGNDDISSNYGNNPSPEKDEDGNIDLRRREATTRRREALTRGRQRKVAEVKETASKPLKRKLMYHSSEEENEPSISPSMRMKKRTKKRQHVVCEESDTSEEDEEEEDTSKGEVIDSDEDLSDDLFRLW